MKTLLLLRHGEAAPAQAGQKDFDRPLTALGCENMVVLGRHLRQRKLMPTVALASAARRTKETLLSVVGSGGIPVDMVFMESLYNASTEKIIDHIAAIDRLHQAALIVSHNPCIHEMAIHLAKDGDHAKREQLALTFSPGTLAVLECPVNDWNAVATSRNRLIDLIVP